jgi:hypothetical protein
VVLSMLMKDKVTLIKADGRRFENLSAMVQPELILLVDVNLPVEEGDAVERVTPGKVVESYQVLEATLAGIPPALPKHYQLTVRKKMRIDPVPPSPQTIYNVTGPNARINIQSTDSSTNIVNVDARTLFMKMKQAVNESVADEATRVRILETVDAMESTTGQPGFIEKYNEFVASAANHMTVLGPFLPALGEILLKALG